MEYRLLGKTGIRVSRLCFGVLTIGPLQAHLPLAEGVSIMRYAVDKGVNFFDTAELYGTYPYLRQLLGEVKGEDLVIASKSYAVTYEEMRQSVERARRELNRDVVDIFLLHEQESELTLKGHQGALEYLVEAKAKGIIKALGISTHHVAGVKAATSVPEIEVIHPLLNYKGLGISDGTVEEMLAAIEEASAAGKGIYLMKPLGGGNLINDVDTALKFAFSQEVAASVAVGMKSREEVEYNVLVASGLPVPEKLKSAVFRKKPKLHIEDWCQGCGECVQACSQKALFVDCRGKARVKEELCVLCGYCAAACPNFCIRVF